MADPLDNLGGDLSATQQSFKAKIEALTGITINTDPTVSEVGIYLRDGVREVTQRSIAIEPADMALFSKAFTVDSNSYLRKDAIGKVVTVLRESGTANDFRACRFITQDLTSRVTDKNSIHYASKFNPAYSIDNKYLNIFPEPSTATASSIGKVYAVNMYPEDTSGRQLTATSHKIGWFPQEKIYLVVIYAAIRVLDKLVNAAQNMPTDLSAPSIRIPVLPVVPTLTSNSLSFTQAAPTYLAPVLTLEDKPTVSDLSISAIVPVTPTLTDNSISFTTTAPLYNQPVAAPDFSDANTWLNTEEDSELVASRMQIINGQLQEYQNNIQNNLNKFNEENAEYQAELQRSIQNAQLGQSDDGQKVQKYQAEVSAYQAQVNQEVQEYTQNFQKELQLWQINRNTSIQKYQADLQNNLNVYNKENAAYQLEFQRAVQNATLSSKDDDQAIQKYQSQLTAYSAEVNREVQEISKLTAETQKYSAQVQKVKMDIDLYHQRSQKLQQQYDAAFQFMAQPLQQAQQKQGRRG